MCVRPGSYSILEYLKVASLEYSSALMANIRLGWKGLIGTHTLAYHENL